MQDLLNYSLNVHTSTIEKAPRPVVVMVEYVAGDVLIEAAVLVSSVLSPVPPFAFILTANCFETGYDLLGTLSEYYIDSIEQIAKDLANV